MKPIQESDHDKVLSIVRKMGQGIVMRGNVRIYDTQTSYSLAPCAVLDLNRSVPLPGSSWERTDKVICTGITWGDVLRQLGALQVAS